MYLGRLGLIVPVLVVLVKVLQTVNRQGGVTGHVEPRQRRPVGIEFDTGAVTLVYVGGKALAYIALGTRLYKLVLVVHVVEVQTSVPVGCAVAVTQLEVGEVLGAGSSVATIVGKIVALGLAAGVGY